MVRISNKEIEFKSLRELKELSTFTFEEDKWTPFLEQLEVSYQDCIVPIKEGVLKLRSKDLICYAHFKDLGDEFGVDCYALRGYSFEYTYGFTFLPSQAIEGVLVQTFCKESDKEIFVGKDQSSLESFAYTIVRYFAYINQTFRNRDTVYIKDRTKHNSNTLNNSMTYRHKVQIIDADKRIYLYDSYNDISKHYKRHIEAWNVMGHYRHYKSGKVVFIKPYIKGQGLINKKEYIIKNKPKE